MSRQRIPEASDDNSVIHYGRYVGEYLLTMFPAKPASIVWSPTPSTTKFGLPTRMMVSPGPSLKKTFLLKGPFRDILRRDNTLYAFGGRGTIKRYRFDTDEWEDPVDYSTTGDDIRWNDKSPVLGDDGLIHLFFSPPRLKMVIQQNAQPTAKPIVLSTSALLLKWTGVMVRYLKSKKNPISSLRSHLEKGHLIRYLQLADGRWGMLITWLEGTAFFTSDTLHGEYFLSSNSEHHHS